MVTATITTRPNRHPIAMPAIEPPLIPAGAVVSRPGPGSVISGPGVGNGSNVMAKIMNRRCTVKRVSILPKILVKVCQLQKINLMCIVRGLAYTGNLMGPKSQLPEYNMVKV